MMHFNLEQIYYLSQTVGSLAVIGSVFYLAIQVRDQNRESRRKAVADLTANLGNYQASVAADEKLVELWLKGIWHYENLSAVEKTRFAFMFNHGMRIWECLYLDYLDGRISQEMLDAYLSPVERLVTLPGVQAFWGDRRWWYQARFRDFIDGLVHTARDSGAPAQTWPLWNASKE